MKIAIWSTDDNINIGELEDIINDWMSDESPRIKFVKQNFNDGVLTITVFYEEFISD